MATNNDISYIAFTFGYEDQADITPENIEVEITAIDDEEGTSSLLQPKAYYIGETAVFKIYLGETLIFSRDTSNEETPTPDPDFVNIFPSFTEGNWNGDIEGYPAINTYNPEEYSISFGPDSVGYSYYCFISDELRSQLIGSTVTFGAESISGNVSISIEVDDNTYALNSNTLQITIDIPSNSNSIYFWMNNQDNNTEIRNIYLYVH